MTSTLGTYCGTCKQETLTDDRGFCLWCDRHPATGELNVKDREAMARRRREQTTLASQRLRARRAGQLSEHRSQVNDRRPQQTSPEITAAGDRRRPS